MTPTPPPKEFKRMNCDRKTLRNTRCLSTVVTDKERALVTTFTKLFFLLRHCSSLVGSGLARKY
jgi:hypothetical protein